MGVAWPPTLLLVLLLAAATSCAAQPKTDKIRFDFNVPGGALGALGVTRLARIRRVNGQMNKSIRQLAQMLQDQDDLVSESCCLKCFEGIGSSWIASLNTAHPRSPPTLDCCCCCTPTGPGPDHRPVDIRMFRHGRRPRQPSDGSSSRCSCRHSRTSAAARRGRQVLSSREPHRSSSTSR